MVWFKRGIFALVILFALIAATIAWLFIALDANQYKPQLQALAAERGLALTIDGDIGWQLWPDIALEFEGVKLAPLAAPEQQLLRADKIAVRVALMPLLKKHIEAKEIVLLGPQIELTVDAEGRGNWEPLMEALNAQRQAQQAPPKLEVAPPDADASGKTLQLELAKLRVEQGLLSYNNTATNTRYRLDRLDIAVDNFALGRPGQIELKAQLQGTPLKQPVDLAADTRLTVDSDFSAVHLQPLTLSLTSGAAAAKVSLRGNLQRKDARSPWRIQMHLNATAEPLAPWLAVAGSQQAGRGGDALQQLKLEADISGTRQQLSIEPLQLRLDDTLFTGGGALSSGDLPTIELTLRGDTLMLDKYLSAPAAASTEKASAPAPSPQAAPISAPLPFAQLRGFNARLTLSLQSLDIQKLVITQPQLQLTVDNGLYQLQALSADLFGGKLNSSGQFNARGDSASAEISGGLANVDIARLQQALFDDHKVQFSGMGSLTWALQTSGASLEQLRQQLRGAVRVDSQNLAMAPFNLEQSMCQLVSYVEKTPLPEREWPAQTQLQDLHANINIRGDQLRVQQINAGVENLTLTGDGDVNLQKQHFDFALGLALTGAGTSRDGCTVRNERWRNRPLPLRCEGNFSSAGIGSCKPDSRRLDDLIREELKYQAEKKLGNKAKDKLNELKDRLKGLFGG